MKKYYLKILLLFSITFFTFFGCSGDDSVSSNVENTTTTKIKPENILEVINNKLRDSILSNQVYTAYFFKDETMEIDTLLKVVMENSSTGENPNTILTEKIEEEIDNYIVEVMGLEYIDGEYTSDVSTGEVYEYDIYKFTDIEVYLRVDYYYKDNTITFRLYGSDLSSSYKDIDNTSQVEDSISNSNDLDKLVADVYTSNFDTTTYIIENDTIKNLKIIEYVYTFNEDYVIDTKEKSEEFKEKLEDYFYNFIGDYSEYNEDRDEEILYQVFLYPPDNDTLLIGYYSDMLVFIFYDHNTSSENSFNKDIFSPTNFSNYILDYLLPLTLGEENYNIQKSLDTVIVVSYTGDKSFNIIETNINDILSNSMVYLYDYDGYEGYTYNYRFKNYEKLFLDVIYDEGNNIIKFEMYGEDLDTIL